MPAAVQIRQVSAMDGPLQRLIIELDNYHGALYPPESNHLDSPQALSEPDVFLLGAYSVNEPVGCGAIRIVGDYGEIKRLYVASRHRGKGIGRMILSSLEQHAADQGIPITRLETGIYQKEALSLYKRMGYSETRPFWNYSADPLSVFMEKRLRPG